MPRVARDKKKLTLGTLCGYLREAGAESPQVDRIRAILREVGVENATETDMETFCAALDKTCSGKEMPPLEGWKRIVWQYGNAVLVGRAARMAKAALRAGNAASAALRDIGPIPEVKDPKRRRACKRDLKRFLKTYFPEKFPLPFGEAHDTVIAKIEDATLNGGLFSLALPRGSGKTTICERAALWAEAYGHRRFVALIGASEDAARASLDEIKMEWETNDRLFEDFPEIAYPVRRLEGINIRANGQTVQGKRTRMTWSDTEVVFPTVTGSSASGSVIQVRGLTGRIRGMKAATAAGESLRPDLVLIDDPQTDESAASPEQNRKRIAILTGAILGLAGPGKKISGVMPCTVIRKGDMADQILDNSRHPEWQGERRKMMVSFPANKKLWARYAEILQDGYRDGIGISRATEFYQQHRAEMDEGAEVYWEARKNDDEASAIQSAMNLYLRDKDSFYSEYQNEPIDDSGGVAERLTVARVWEKMDGAKRNEVPAWADYLTMYVDVQKRLLYYVVTATGRDFTSRVIDYGSWPGQARRYWTLNDAMPNFETVYKGKSLESAIYSAIDELVGAKLEAKWKTEDGRELELAHVAVDSAWGQSTKTVYRVCRDLQKRFGLRIIAARGRGITAAQKPFGEYRKEQGVKIGENWRIFKVRGAQSVRIMEIDTNWWKSFLRQRVLSPKGEGGTWTVWGEDEEGHRMFAEHLSSEQSVTTSSEWRVVDIWSLIPGRENHLFDCAVGSLALASWCGASLNVGAEVLEDSRKREAKAAPPPKQVAPAQTLKRIVPLSARKIVPH